MFIVHIHVSTKPGRCFWLVADGTLTANVESAHEFKELDEACAVLANMGDVALRDDDGQPTGVAEGQLHYFTNDTLPPSIRRMLRVD